MSNVVFQSSNKALTAKVQAQVTKPQAKVETTKTAEPSSSDDDSSDDSDSSDDNITQAKTVYNYLTCFN